MKKAIDLIRQSNEIEVPRFASSILGVTKIRVNANEAHITEGGDWESLENIRKTIEFLVDQFGGEVKWDVSPKPPEKSKNKKKTEEKHICDNLDCEGSK